MQSRHIAVAFAVVAGAAGVVAGALVVSAPHAPNPRAVLYSGFRGHPTSDAEARAAAAKGLRMWLNLVPPAGQVQIAPQKRRWMPTGGQLARDLDRVGRLYGFKVVSIRMMRWGAPKVVVETRQYEDFAMASPGILDTLDPGRHIGKQSTFTWRGFFLQANDELGVPFLVAAHFSNAGGSGWARSQALFPWQVAQPSL